jgi:hypothetical protein
MILALYNARGMEMEGSGWRRSNERRSTTERREND